MTASKLEYTTQKLRQEWEAEKEQMQQEEQQIKAAAKEIAEISDNLFRPIEKEETTPVQATPSKSEPIEISIIVEEKQVKEDTKSKKKRRKKSVLKKKNNPASMAQRKNSSSSGQSDQNEVEAENNSISITTTSSNDSSMPELSMKESLKVEESPVLEDVTTFTENDIPARHLELDIHFFSDTEAQTGSTPHRPSSPVQSDTEFEFSQRESTNETSINSASWKWGELPNPPEGTDAKHDVAESKRSMLSGMFSFMKQGRKMRKTNEGLYLEDFENEDIDPEVAALYFPEHHLRNKEKNNSKAHEDDRESGNGTSVPQSPTSMEGIKSLDSDYDDGKQSDKYLDFVAISMCGGLDKGNPTDEEFKKYQLQFAEVNIH